MASCSREWCHEPPNRTPHRCQALRLCRFQLGLHLKPVGLLNVEGYYDPLLALLDHMREQGFLAASHREMLAVERHPEPLLDRLLHTRHTAIPKAVHPVIRQA